MSVIPQWIIGKNVVTTIAAVTVTAGTGVISVSGSSTTLTAVLDEVSIELVNTTENIVPMDVRQDNEVITGTAQNLVLTEILNSNNYLAAAGIAGDYVQITIARAGKTWTSVCVIKNYSETMVRGKSTGKLTLGATGIAVTYA